MIYKHGENEEIECIDNIKRIETTVRWYDPRKGYGFLATEHHVADIMIHFSDLDLVKCPYIIQGDKIVCDISFRNSRLKVERVIEVKYVSPEKRSHSSFAESQLTPSEHENLEEMEGTVKWYNPQKGYGFVLPHDGRKEIFLHASVVRMAGYKSLEPGLRVLVKVLNSERGKNVRILRVLDNPETNTLMCSREAAGY